MRYLEVSVDQSADERNRMHQFVVDHDAYERSRLLHRDRYERDEHAMVFHVEGPRDPYERALANGDTVRDYAISGCPDGSFYLYVRATLAGDDRTFADAFDQPGLLVVPPVTYRADGTVRLTAVGPADAVQSAVDDVPGQMGVDVRAVGTFDAGRLDVGLELTQRQFEAVAAAVDAGYYATPRSATLDDVATRLDCSTGTAGELLRRAERTVMADLVADSRG